MPDINAYRSMLFRGLDQDNSGKIDAREAAEFKGIIQYCNGDGNISRSCIADRTAIHVSDYLLLNPQLNKDTSAQFIGDLNEYVLI